MSAECAMPVVPLVQLSVERKVVKKFKNYVAFLSLAFRRANFYAWHLTMAMVWVDELSIWGTYYTIVWIWYIDHKKKTSWQAYTVMVILFTLHTCTFSSKACIQKLPITQSKVFCSIPKLYQKLYKTLNTFKSNYVKQLN